MPFHLQEQLYRHAFRSLSSIRTLWSRLRPQLRRRQAKPGSRRALSPIIAVSNVIGSSNLLSKRAWDAPARLTARTWETLLSELRTNSRMTGRIHAKLCRILPPLTILCASDACDTRGGGRSRPDGSFTRRFRLYSDGAVPTHHEEGDDRSTSDSSLDGRKVRQELTAHDGHHRD